MARDYDAYWASLTASHNDHPGNRFRYRLIARELVSMGVRPRRILDCGCGDGSLLAVVARHIPFSELRGMDIAQNVPIGRAGVPIDFRQHDLGTPIPKDLAGGFDLVLCSEVIEHVADDAAVLRNLYALAALGGTVVLTTQTGQIYKTEQFLGHLRHYDLADLCRRLEEAGLRVKRAYRTGWPWLKLQKIVAHHFQHSVQKNIVQAKELGPVTKALFGVLYHLYKVSSKRLGPQLLIVAEKPAAG